MKRLSNIGHNKIVHSVAVPALANHSRTGIVNNTFRATVSDRNTRTISAPNDQHTPSKHALLKASYATIC